MIIKFELPLDWQLSKNRKFIGRTKKVLNPKYVMAKSLVAWELRRQLSKTKETFEKRKIWVKILVVKANLRGDGHNLIEGVCDAIKTEIKIDDNVYSGSWDWDLGKDEKLIIEISQEIDEKDKDGDNRHRKKNNRKDD